MTSLLNKVVNCLTTELKSFMLKTIPVSYTHLDVYKRQVRNIPLQRCGTASPRKIIGPQYAVTIATNTPEQVMTSRREMCIRDSLVTKPF